MYELMTGREQRTNKQNG